ncbi:MAG: VOC family protein [Bacteroidaceae bacterium]|nr:VOC family protein [Bacteroidaceae bacterium]
MKIDHIALYCLDLEGMKEFFIRYFNGVSNEMYHNPKTGLKTYILSFQDSDARLELMTRPEVVNEEENIYRQGLIHLSFSVGSKEKVDSLTKLLNEEGYQVLSGPRTTGDGYYESCIVGPENILIEITI